MRLSLCYRIVRLKGFFWGRRLFIYKRRIAGWQTPAGLGFQPRGWLWALGDGFFARFGFKGTRHTNRYPLARLRNAGYAHLRLIAPQLEPI